MIPIPPGSPLIPCAACHEMVHAVQRGDQRILVNSSGTMHRNTCRHVNRWPAQKKEPRRV